MIVIPIGNLVFASAEGLPGTSTLYEQMTHAQLVAALTALQRAAQAGAHGAPLPSPAEAERLIRDLHARQLELERQNRELHEARQPMPTLSRC